MARASRPLPVPVSPRIKGGGGRVVGERRRRSCSTCARRATSPGLSPINGSSDATVRAFSAASSTTGGFSPPASAGQLPAPSPRFPVLPPLALPLRSPQEQSAGGLVTTAGGDRPRAARLGRRREEEANEEARANHRGSCPECGARGRRRQFASWSITKRRSGKAIFQDRRSGGGHGPAPRHASAAVGAARRGPASLRD